MKCLQCKKEIDQPSGKRAKQFCNNSCRSNYWYARNKKGKSKPKVNPKAQNKPIQEPETKPPDTSNTKNKGNDDMPKGLNTIQQLQWRIDHC